ncbi:hypothetical protein ABOM_003074 [Aspergillus bombycis]|uniref:ATP-grasp domain-containing protein n=1 Tax=Aspergillus bombycis TaxID=109264 RepID=A0A1F8ABF5_9EURO|nr:hypothetical protein ABOM_003074 [Aspergillus bombycis]OGM49022.1 hypothetical protein ABOM_003074 [Aspergillus bombycis]
MPVQTKEELLEAMHKNHINFPDREHLIEPYASGPEVDANFVLVDGRIMFSEINDDFPSGADMSQSPSFTETFTIMPSGLPPSELTLLKSHRMSYEMLGRAMDLIERPLPDSQEPSVFLVEINPRTPGHQESFAVEYTYGIDYYALYTLLALGQLPESFGKGNIPDPALNALERLRCPLPEMIQYPTNIAFVPVSRGGTFAGAMLIPTPLLAHIPHY